MPQLDYAILCEHVRVDTDNLAHMIAGGMDTVWVERLPIGQNVGLLLKLSFTRNECDRPHRMEIVFQTEDGERLVQIAATVVPGWHDDLPPGWRANSIVGLNFGIPLPKHGLYSFEVLVNDSSVGTMNYRVVPPKPGQRRGK